MIEITKKDFGLRKDGIMASEYYISNENVTLVVTDHGASITKLFVKDKNGKKRDVALGFDTLAEYEKGTSFGAFVGRVANRISNHSFSLEGKTYELDKNNGNACLHGGKDRYNQKFYESQIITTLNGKGVLFSRISPDGEQGFPGNLSLCLSYVLTEDNEVQIYYKATTDKVTPLNLTNHTFFNLNGEGSGTIEDHQISIKASVYQETDEELIPIKLTPVDNTIYDLRKAKSMKNSDGYDVSLILDHNKDGLASTVYSEASGIKMSVRTDQPALQFYSAKGNNMVGKAQHHYGAFSGFCLETQGYVDAVNHKEYPSILLYPKEEYHHFVGYKFDIVK